MEISQAEAAGLARVTLLAGRGNEAALAFYLRLGFGPSQMVVLRRPLIPSRDLEGKSRGAG